MAQSQVNEKEIRKSMAIFRAEMDRSFSEMEDRLIRGKKSDDGAAARQALNDLRDMQVSHSRIVRHNLEKLVWDIL